MCSTIADVLPFWGKSFPLVVTVSCTPLAAAVVVFEDEEEDQEEEQFLNVSLNRNIH